MTQDEIMQQLKVAVALHNQGDLDKAERIYRQVLALDDNNTFALSFCGSIERVRKNYDAAIALLSRAVALQPSNAETIYDLGNVYKDDSRWFEAITCFEKSLHLRPLFTKALNNLGICLMEVQRYEHSEIVLKRAISIDPDFANPCLNLANLFSLLARDEESLALYAKTIDLDTHCIEAYLKSGDLLLRQGMLEEANIYWLRAIKACSDPCGLMTYLYQQDKSTMASFLFSCMSHFKSKDLRYCAALQLLSDGRYPVESSSVLNQLL